MSFVAELLSPGGGIKLIPFIRVVVMCLLGVCLATFVAGVARIHMFVLSCLSGGLLVSIAFFEHEFHRMHGGGSRSSSSSNTTQNNSRDNVASSASTSASSKGGECEKTD